MSFNSIVARTAVIVPTDSFQTTSVNPNSSFSMTRTGWPTGAYTVTFRSRFLDWASASQYHALIYARYGAGGASSESSFYGETVANELRLFEPTLGQQTFASGSPTDWLYIYFQWDGNPANAVTWNMKVGAASVVTYSLVLGAASTLYDIQVFNDVYAEQAGNARGCTLSVWDGMLTSGELTSQAASDVPISTGGGSGATLWAFYPMSSAATAHIDSSGNTRDMTPTGTGVTETDSPY